MRSNVNELKKKFERDQEMEFNELIEARRSVRKYAAVIALGKAAGAAAKPLRKPVGAVLAVS